MEKLIPFDFAKFQKDPSRLRLCSSTPRWAEPIRDCVALIAASGSAYLFKPDEFNSLRLAAKTRIVRVRLYRHCNSGVYAMTDGGRYPQNLNDDCEQWVSNIIEVEVAE